MRLTTTKPYLTVYQSPSFSCPTGTSSVESVIVAMKTAFALAMLSGSDGTMQIADAVDEAANMMKPNAADNFM